jgi:glycosyltransferase involved in cell wall biosynthesis/Tfp pilus assembly protein PilF
MLPITLCLPVLNDEKLLKVSLDAFNGQVAEILVVDFGSSDASLQVAKAFAAETLQLDWQNHWGYVLSQARQKASQAWVWWVFPGEVPSPEFWQNLPDLLTASEQIECICESPQDIRAENRIFKAHSVDFDSQFCFPLFRASINRSKQTGFAEPGLLQADSLSWARSPEVVGPLLDLASKEAVCDPAVKLLAGIRAFERQNDTLAKEIFEELQHPDEKFKDSDFIYLAARLYLLKTNWELGQHQQAFEQLDRVRQSHPLLENQPGLWVLRGVMARQVQERELARECFQEALTLAQSDTLMRYNPLLQKPDITWKPWIGLGEIFFEEGLFTQAYHAFAAARKTLPEHTYLVGQFVRTAFLTRNYAAMQTVLKQYSDLPGISAAVLQALNTIVLASLQAGKADVLQEPNLSEILLTELKQDSQTALNSSANPFLLSVALEYALVLLQNQALVEARSLLQHLTLRLPGQAMLWHNLAFSYFASKDYRQAETFYRQALLAQPDFHESRFDLGKVLVMQGQIEAACEEFEKILAENPQHLLARKALNQLQASSIPVGMPAPSKPVQTAQPEQEPPFVFVFPLEANWENGLDIALKAYFEEFVTGDNVVLALTQKKGGPELERAKAWAEQRFTPDLLPPVVLLEKSLPLLPEKTCWLLPCRVSPGQALLDAVQSSPFPALVTGFPLPHLVTGFLPTHVHTNATESESMTETQVWWEVDGTVLKNQMRLALEGFLSKESSDSNQTWETHSLLDKAPKRASKISLENMLAPPVDTAQDLRISVCMIVRDEERLLEQCLQSIEADVDEIIVVDTGSRDRTLEIARRHPKVKIFERVWQADFAEARNAALAEATCPWILVLDADEFLPAGFIPNIRQYLQHHNQRVDAYVFSIVALDEDGVEVATDTLPVPRLFANTGAYHFQGRVHELLTHTEQKQMVYVHIQGLPIYHQGYQTQVRLDKQKLQRDTQLMQQMIAEAPKDIATERMYLILGQGQENAQNLQKALDYYRLGLSQIVSTSPLRETLQKGVWRVELKKGDPRPVHSAVNPETCQDPESLLLWAEACLQMGLQAEALQGYELALAVSDRSAGQPDIFSQRPPRSQIFENLLKTYEQMGQAATALYFSERLVKENPSQASAWHYYRKLHQISSLA